MKRQYIFITPEGFTFQPHSEDAEPDIENLQVLGFGEGNDEESALADMLRNHEYLKKTRFREAYALELKERTWHPLSLTNTSPLNPTWEVPCKLLAGLHLRQEMYTTVIQKAHAQPRF